MKLTDEDLASLENKLLDGSYATARATALRVIAALKETQAEEQGLRERVAECEHPDNGHIHVRICCKCGKPYPEWTVVSSWKCAKCHTREQNAMRVEKSLAAFEKHLEEKFILAANDKVDGVVPISGGIRWIFLALRKMWSDETEVPDAVE